MENNTAKKNHGTIEFVSSETTSDTGSEKSGSTTTNKTAEAEATAFVAKVPTKITIDLAAVKPVVELIVVGLAQVSDRLDAIEKKHQDDFDNKMEALKTDDMPFTKGAGYFRLFLDEITVEGLGSVATIADTLLNIVAPKGESGKRVVKKELFTSIIKIEK